MYLASFTFWNPICTVAQQSWPSPSNFSDHRWKLDTALWLPRVTLYVISRRFYWALVDRLSALRTGRVRIRPGKVITTRQTILAISDTRNYRVHERRPIRMWKRRHVIDAEQSVLSDVPKNVIILTGGWNKKKLTIRDEYVAQIIFL